MAPELLKAPISLKFSFETIFFTILVVGLPTEGSIL